MSMQNLFVAKLPRNVGDADLYNIFAPYGPSSAKIMLDAATGKSKGFGFVLFDTEEKGSKAFKALNREMTRACGHNFTLVIYPSNHNGRTVTEESNALYIRNIPVTVTQDRVQDFLRTFGNLTYFAMREDHYGQPVWVVYAEYETVEEAKNALKRLHGNNTYFQGGAPILAKFEDSDDAKKERRRRREGTQSNAPSSGCIFPPPREGLGSSMGETVSNAKRSADSGSRHASMDNVAGAFPGSTQNSFPGNRPVPSYGAFPPAHGAPPSYLSTMSVGSSDMNRQHLTPNSAFSLPQQLLRPTPGYCYTLAESGQQIFIPSTSFSPPAATMNFSPVPQSAPCYPPHGLHTEGFSLLTPQPEKKTVVLLDGGQQYVVAPDVINMRASPQSEASASHARDHGVSSPTGSTNPYASSFHASAPGTSFDAMAPNHAEHHGSPAAMLFTPFPDIHQA